MGDGHDPHGQWPSIWSHTSVDRAGKGKNVKKHRTPKLSDAEIAQRWVQRKAQERDRYARTVAWLRCCALRRVPMGTSDAYILSCPGGHHEMAVIDDHAGHLETRCAHCFFPQWRLHQHIDTLLETA
jgi:hypothetical protein